MKFHKTSIILQRNVFGVEVGSNNHHLRATITAADLTTRVASVAYLVTS